MINHALFSSKTGLREHPWLYDYWASILPTIYLSEYLPMLLVFCCVQQRSSCSYYWRDYPASHALCWHVHLVSEIQLLGFNSFEGFESGPAGLTRQNSHKPREGALLTHTYNFQPWIIWLTYKKRESFIKGNIYIAILTLASIPEVKLYIFYHVSKYYYLLPTCYSSCRCWSLSSLHRLDDKTA